MFSIFYKPAITGIGRSLSSKPLLGKIKRDIPAEEV